MPKTKLVPLECHGRKPVGIYLMAAEKINLNTATLEELMTLKRIGPKYAQRIIDYRDTPDALFFSAGAILVFSTGRDETA